jgi:hypothetical protein
MELAPWNWRPIGPRWRFHAHAKREKYESNADGSEIHSPIGL